MKFSSESPFTMLKAAKKKKIVKKYILTLELMTIAAMKRLKSFNGEGQECDR